MLLARLLSKIYKKNGIVLIDSLKGKNIFAVNLIYKNH